MNSRSVMIVDIAFAIIIIAGLVAATQLPINQRLQNSLSGCLQPGWTIKECGK